MSYFELWPYIKIIVSFDVISNVVCSLFLCDISNNTIKASYAMLAYFAIDLFLL